MANLTLDQVREGLATLRAKHKHQFARLPNGWLLVLHFNYQRKRWELDALVRVYRYSWFVKPEYLHFKRGNCSWGSNDQVTIDPSILDAMAAKLLVRLAAIEADYLPRFGLFRSWPIERVRYRVLGADDVVDTSGWQILMDGAWHTLGVLVERDDVPALIERCEALGHERFLAPTHADRGLSLMEIEELALGGAPQTCPASL